MKKIVIGIGLIIGFYCFSDSFNIANSAIVVVILTLLNIDNSLASINKSNLEKNSVFTIHDAELELELKNEQKK